MFSMRTSGILRLAALILMTADEISSVSSSGVWASYTLCLSHIPIKSNCRPWNRICWPRLSIAKMSGEATQNSMIVIFSLWASVTAFPLCDWAPLCLTNVSLNWRCMPRRNGCFLYLLPYNVQMSQHWWGKLDHSSYDWYSVLYCAFLQV